jgi:hypothetical protein
VEHGARQCNGGITLPLWLMRNDLAG